MLKEVKSRYAGTCNKCNRELKIGWTVFFNPDDKKTYCKPCGTHLQKGEVQEDNTNSKATAVDKSAGMKIIEELISISRLNSDLLASLDDKVRDLIVDVAHLDNYIRDAKKVASTKAKS